MDKLTPPTLTPPNFQDLTYRCHLCKDTGYSLYEKRKWGHTYSFASKCFDGNCPWWKWWKQESATINNKLKERFDDDDQ